jgi:hypothetical protein
MFLKTGNFISLICCILSWGLWYVSCIIITETCTRNYPTAQESTRVLTCNALGLSIYYTAFFFLWSYKIRSKWNYLKYHDDFLDCHKSTWVMHQCLLPEIYHALVLWRFWQTIVSHSKSLTYLLDFPLYLHGSFHYWNT